LSKTPPLPHDPQSPSSPGSVESSQMPLSNSQIEAVIQMATASATVDSHISGRDTRTQLFVGNLPYRVRWQDLKDLFRKAGTVLRADVSLGPDNRSRGYGTVLLATSEDAARAVDMFNGYNWQTRTLEVRLDRLLPDFSDPSAMLPSAGSLPSISGKVFPIPVHPLPFHCQWQDLKDLFRQAGTVVRADVALGPDGRSRGFGTVSFANDSDAERALNLLNGSAEYKYYLFVITDPCCIDLSIMDEH
ncbi:RNA-binding domain-containing protein, partial [Hysterangium stoloniferum]